MAWGSGGATLSGVYEISVEDEFCAAHALLIAGAREAVHGHNWRVTLTVVGERLDDDGLLVDFHAVARVLNEVLGPLRNADLNRTPPFDAVNPSAEAVARHIAVEVGCRLAGVRVSGVRVTEAPGCAVTYRPG